VVAAHLIAAEAAVGTARGVVRGADLHVGDELVVVDRNGALRHAAVTATRDVEEPVALRWLLTHAGEILVPERAQLSASTGMLIAADFIDGSRRRVELISPTDLPRAGKEVRPLEALAPLRSVIPKGNGTADVARPVILEAAARLGVDATVTETDRWLAVAIPEQPAPTEDWTWDDELRLLRALCAWEVRDAGIFLARTRMDQAALRRRLIGVHVAARQQFRVDWLPAYYPVECRVSPESDTWPPYAVVQRSLSEIGRATVIETDASGSPVIGSAIVRCVSE
jgi:hypothetical protein